MDVSQHLSIILIAFVLDALFGDPVYRFHPTRVIGAWSQLTERWLFSAGKNDERGGVVHWWLVVGGAVIAWLAIHILLGLISSGLAFIWDVYIAYSLLCMRDLLTHGQRVLDSLKDLPEARRQLSMMVERDTKDLPRDGVVRATIESLAENLTDGVLTPFWALCLFGLPGLILVKAISSLDSMVGHKNERYERFGRLAARSDDMAHWLPARLSPIVISAAAAFLRMHPISAWRSALKYHSLLPSPNSGWSEAAYAGALEVRLVGPIQSGGKLVTDVYVGEPTWSADLDAPDLRRALQLTLFSGVMAIPVGLLLAQTWRLASW